ncbi:MAG TPA: hypothetical protein VFT29_11265 [Gemmatimonadaceae bacterium]|nr:hypothetical protein [Gemmatimonadaceae bacterium]
MRLNPRLSAAAIAAVTLMAVACDEDDHTAALPAAPIGVAANEVSAYVAVSSANPAPGSDVTVWVRARRGSAMGPVGSYTLRLTYDSTRMRFKESGRSQHGMVMANSATAGLLVVAGASAEGFADDELLAATFTSTSTGALTGLTLDVTELNSATFQDQKAGLRVARGLYSGEQAKK